MLLGRTRAVYPWKSILITDKNEEHPGPEPAVLYCKYIYFKEFEFLRQCTIKKIILLSEHDFIFAIKDINISFCLGDTLKFGVKPDEYSILLNYKPNQRKSQIYRWNSPEDLYRFKEFRLKKRILDLFKKEPKDQKVWFGKSSVEIKVKHGI